MANNIKQTAIQMANQVIGQLSQQPPSVVRIPPKPIFIIRVPIALTTSEIQNVKDAVYKELENEYHILFASSPSDDFQFEMYNADKIEVQKWNELVIRIFV